MNTHNIVGDIEITTVQDFFKFVDEIEEEEIDVTEVTIRVCSEGGSADAALAIVGLIKSRPDIHWVTEGYGNIESAASLIFAAGNERKLSHAATVMVHPGTYKKSSDAWELQEYASFLLDYENHWADLIAQYTNTKSDLWLVKKDTYMFAKQCLEVGYATEII